MDFNLNRYKYNINDTTPDEVISALVACCGKSVDKNLISERREAIVSFLENYKYQLPPQEEYYGQQDFARIANFVSPEASAWQKENLLRAMQHIIAFDEKLELSLPAQTGTKSNDNIFVYDIIMLYNYCFHKEIALERDDNLDSMMNKIEIYQKEANISKEDCLLIMEDNMMDCSKADLLQMMKLLPSWERKERVEKIVPVKEEVIVEQPRPLKSVDEIKNSININYMISRSQLDENEALVYGAKFLALNLKDSSARVKELMEYNRCRMEDISYTPLEDDLFSRNYKSNPYYYRMDYFWHPDIADLYPQKNIALLLKNEGLRQEDGRGELDASLCFNNFYLGIIPGHEKETFVYKYSAENVEKNKLISYGVRQENKFILLSVSEIIAHFKNHNSLVDFERPEEKINEKAIKKLTVLCKFFSSDDEYCQLLEMIEELKNKKVAEDNILEDFKNKYLFASDQIDRVLEEVFFLSMYTRGWKINDLLDYPLAEKDCLAFSDYEKKIEDNVRISSRKVEQLIERIADKSIKNMIYQLPLMKYNRKDGSFNKSTNPDEGLTLYERIKLINENSENIYACIRLSSNHLATSAYYYLDILAGKKLFNLSKLEFIQ